MSSKSPYPSASSAARAREPLAPSVADKLLDLLSSDNAFRDLFQRDPLAALVRAGQPLPPISSQDAAAPLPLLGSLKVNQLAPKEEIARSRAEIRAFLLSADSQNAAFEAGRVSALHD